MALFQCHGTWETNGILKKEFAAAMQSLEKVPRSLEEAERAPGSMQVGSAGS